MVLARAGCLAVLMLAVTSCVAADPASRPAASPPAPDLASAAGPAGRAAGPNSVRGTAVLDSQAVRLDLLAHLPNRVRVTADFGVKQFEAPWADPAGLHYRPTPEPRPALFVGAGAIEKSVPNPVPWSRVARIERPEFHWGNGTLIGAVAGGLAGITAYSVSDHGGENWAALYIPMAVILGALTGTIATAGEHWIEVSSRDSRASMHSGEATETTSLRMD